MELPNSLVEVVEQDMLQIKEMVDKAVVVMVLLQVVLQQMVHLIQAVVEAALLRALPRTRRDG